MNSHARLRVKRSVPRALVTFVILLVLATVLAGWGQAQAWQLVKTFRLTVNPPIDGATYYVSYSTKSGETWSSWTTLELHRVNTSNVFEAKTDKMERTYIKWQWIVKIGTNTVQETGVFGPEYFDADKTNTYTFNYQIDIQPPSATNLVGEPEVFTITVSETVTGKPLANVVVHLSTDFGTLSGTSVTTNSSGQATFSINSSLAGKANIKAWIDILGGTSGSYDVGEVSDTAIKTWKDYRISITPETVTNLVGESETFTVLLETTTDGINWSSASGEMINLSITAPAYFVSIGGVPAFGQTGSGITDGSGNLAVVVKSDSPTPAILTAAFQIWFNETLITRSDTSTKTWEDYRLLGDPTSVTNLVGEAHTFTFTLQKNTGEGWVSAGSGYVLSFSVTSPAYFTDSLIQTTTKVTDTNGQVQVTVKSDSATVAILSGSYNYSETISFDAPSVIKTWKDYRISITPETVTNLVGESETFTVYLETTTDGTNWSAASDETISLSITSPAYFVSIGGVPASGQAGSGTTNESGNLAVVVKSDSPTTATLTATFQKLFDETPFTRSDTSTKEWIPRAKISGHKFNDANGNGVWDKETELPLSGWEINLSGNASMSTTTDSNGYYEFASLEPGTYIVSEVLKSGWTQSAPTSGSYTLSVLSGQEIMDQDFGNYSALGVITGVKWNDLNKNGIQDSGEPVLSSWLITLYASDGTTILATQVSGADGSYKFNNLAPGTYWVGETLPSIDWDNTTPLKVQITIVVVGEEAFVAIANFGNVLAVLPFTPQPRPAAPAPTPGVLPLTGGQPILLRWPIILGTAAVLGWILMAVGYLITRLEKKRS